MQENQDVIVLKERYQLERQLGQGGQGKTWLATDRTTQEAVVVKHLSLKETERWKQIELFEREGEVLQGLEHEQIPHYVEMFAELDEDRAEFYLVQEFIDGMTLAEELSASGCWTPQKAVEDLRAMLELLVWLQARVPPVIHRDIKPSNIMRRAGNGQLVLIDFGAVQLAGTDASHASTFVGTASYMAFEQMSGKALPASDVYSLGVSFCQLITGTPPGQVEMEGSSLGYAPLLRECGVSGRLLEVLERMIQLSLNERYPNAQAALRALNREAQGPGPVVTLPVPIGSGGVIELETVDAQTKRTLLSRYGDPTRWRGLGLFKQAYVEREITDELRKIDGFLNDARDQGFELSQYQDWYGFPLKESLMLSKDQAGVAHLLRVRGTKNTSNQNENPYHYYDEIFTLFEDGHYIVTRKAMVGESREAYRVVVGSGDFYRDYREHMRAVRRYAAHRGVRVVADLNLDEIVLVYKGMLRHTAFASRLLLSLVSFGVVVLWGALTWFYQRAKSAKHSRSYAVDSWRLTSDEEHAEDTAHTVKIKLDFESPLPEQEQSEQRDAVLMASYD